LRVVVIGAGVVGAAVAAGLTRRGADVTVLEARRPGSGTTTTSFAWINAGNKNPDSYYRLNHAGVHAHHEFAGDGAPWFFPTGNLEWAVSEDDRSALARRIDKAHERDYPVQQLTAEQAAALEPDLIGQPAGTEYVLFPTEAHTYPALLLARLLGEAKDGGATIISPAQVTAVEDRAGTLSVETADSARHTADIVISCAGRWTEQVAELAGAYAPMLDPDLAGSATVGFLATTALVPTRLSRVLTAPDLNVRPDGAGRLLLQTLDLDRLADPTAPPALDSAIAKEMAGRLPGVLRTTEGAAIEKMQVGQRALPADGLTIAGFADTAARFYVVATHSGITLAPLLADLVAAEVHGDEAALLGDFRPTRFADATAPRAPSAAHQPGEQ
jgi:D-hydroxyproline dehydrogenase subunit beta